MDDPNKRYYAYNSHTIDSSSVDSFFSRFNHENNYDDGNIKLALGNVIYIEDGILNSIWRIVGFDIEHNQQAADGTVYDNGYGIMLIPYDYLFNAKYSSETGYVNGAYLKSYANSRCTTIGNNLTNLLGSHLVNRNVLLSSSIDTSTGIANGYTWTNAKVTLPSVKQFAVSLADASTNFDYGEANYKLPLYNYNIYWCSKNTWCRNIHYYNAGSTYVYSINSSGLINSTLATSDSPVYRPLIYIR